MCDRFGLLHQGRLIHEGSLEQLRSETGRETLFEMFTDLLVVGGELFGEGLGLFLFFWEKRAAKAEAGSCGS